ncbi:phosphatidylserine decarboxylase [Candidatus Pantoea edessiphila]|uniref:Phosphatidylserine decarboxylase proenzyme n=1 Tax=Candidatus Pantoea edessiphila TaxID=2044610 RepID=A0A2P5SXQ8_9GAMM|nr:archaetidylserine decarboxylase [Candidatus Pantoea edessiphila]MBK4775722.1 phosphatidylserine decarboxylase [Pantoea sp. Edef]PPI87119.1 phosphatidylserine decarboxylase [Candidatus Pantoea edessiphila]
MFNCFKFYLDNNFKKKWLTTIVGRIANSNFSLLTQLIIKIFVWFYKIDMSEAVKQNNHEYITFNSFFVRLLKAHLRPINPDPNIITVPADGKISQIGDIKGNKLFQAKGHYYNIEELLAGDQKMSAKFFNGKFITIYLAPNNYHRVHMPCNGVLRSMIYVPGNLCSVNSIATNRIPNLFARNERIIFYFDTYIGPLIQIMVGAIIVGSIETVWAGTIIPPHGGLIKKWYYPEANNKNSITLLKGQEMAFFKLGSTVISLFTPDRMEFIAGLEYKKHVTVGTSLAVVKSPIFSKKTK